MDIVLKNNPGFKTSWQNRHVHEAIMAALDRFSYAVKTVSVFLSDQNGPKGGKDKTCTLVIDTSSGDRIVVRDTRSEWNAAIHSSLKRSKYKLTRLMGKIKPNKKNHKLLSSTPSLPAAHRRL